MNDIEARFQSLRERASAFGLDVTVIVAQHLREGDRATLIGGGGVSIGRKIGPDETSLAESLLTVDGFLTGLELTGYREKSA